MIDNQLDRLLLDARPDETPPAPITRRHLSELRDHNGRRGTGRRSPVLVAAVMLFVAAVGWLAVRSGAPPTEPDAIPAASTTVTSAPPAEPTTTVTSAPPAEPTTTVTSALPTLPAEAGEFPPVVSGDPGLVYKAVEFEPEGGLSVTWDLNGTTGRLDIRPGDTLPVPAAGSETLATDLPVMGRQATIVDEGEHATVMWVKEGFVFLLTSTETTPDELAAVAQTLEISSQWTWADWTPTDSVSLMPESELLQSGTLGSAEWQVVVRRRRGDPSWCLQVTPWTATDWFCLSTYKTYRDPILLLRPVARGSGRDRGTVLMVGVFGERAVEIRISGDGAPAVNGPASVRPRLLDDGHRVLAFGVDDLAEGGSLLVEVLDSEQRVIGTLEFTGPLDTLG